MKKAPPSRKSEAIGTHAAPGVNGHRIHGKHRRPPDCPSFPLDVFHLCSLQRRVTPLGWRRARQEMGGAGSVCSMAHPGWGVRIENRPVNHSPRNSRMNQI